MARDVERIIERPIGCAPLESARLCNFATGGATPLRAHTEWINGPFAGALKSSRTPFVDIFAYASKTGSEATNEALSKRRLDAVHDLVMKAAPNCGLVSRMDESFGERASEGDKNDNSGYWRAVEVYAYGALPPGRAPAPRPPLPPPAPSLVPWWVTNLSVGGISVVDGLGGGFAVGTIEFTNFDVAAIVTENITIGGVSVGLGDGAQVPSKLLTYLGRDPIVGKALSAISLGSVNLPSGARGPVFPGVNRGTLTAVDFRGACLTVFLSGSAGPGSVGGYVVFMGLHMTLANLAMMLLQPALPPEAAAALLATNLVYGSRAIAAFAAGSVQFGFDVGATGNVWVGRIS